jgi:hypothetical protein
LSVLGTDAFANLTTPDRQQQYYAEPRFASVVAYSRFTWQAAVAHEAAAEEVGRLHDVVLAAGGVVTEEIDVEVGHLVVRFYGSMTSTLR